MKETSKRKRHPVNRFDRIVSDPAVLDGQPCIGGHRLAVKRVLKILDLYPDPAERRKAFPGLEEEGIRQPWHMRRRCWRIAPFPSMFTD